MPKQPTLTSLLVKAKKEATRLERELKEKTETTQRLTIKIAELNQQIVTGETPSTTTPSPSTPEQATPSPAAQA